MCSDITNTTVDTPCLIVNRNSLLLTQSFPVKLVVYKKHQILASHLNSAINIHLLPTNWNTGW